MSGNHPDILFKTSSGFTITNVEMQMDSNGTISCLAAATAIPFSSIHNNITVAAYQRQANPIFVIQHPWSDLVTETIQFLCHFSSECTNIMCITLVTLWSQYHCTIVTMLLCYSWLPAGHFFDPTYHPHPPSKMTLLLFFLLHLTSSFAVTIITMASKGHMRDCSCMLNLYQSVFEIDMKSIYKLYILFWWLGWLKVFDMKLKI